MVPTLPKLKQSQIRRLDKLLEMREGYVLDFSNRTFSEFFEDEFGFDIYHEKYDLHGGSKAKRLRALIEAEEGPVVASVVQKLWLWRLASKGKAPVADEDDLWIQGLIAHLQTSGSAPLVQSLVSTAKILDFDTVTRDLNRTLETAQSDPESAITSACSTLESVCRSVLLELGLELPKKRDISSLFRAVREPLKLSPARTDMHPDILGDVQKILTGLGTLVEGVGALRTHAGDAHGREKGFVRIDSRVAGLAVHSAITAALFLIQTWQKHYPATDLHEH
jgi:hypothetical protein